ncbi:MAG: histidine kinase [Saccharofermentans sp.]|nr:histidine kinase [Saccharofermentans sp.]
MIHRIADKTLITIITAAAIVFTYEDVAAVHVASLLLMILCILSSDIISHRYTPFVMAVISIVTTIVNPIFAFSIIGCVYLFMYRRDVCGYVCAGVMALLPFGINLSTRGSLLIMLISLVAGYIAFNTSLSLTKVTTSMNKYDEARQEARDAANKRREMREKTENDIYTARLKERNRIAREIHDNVGHQITRVIVQMQALKIINKDPNVGTQLDSVSETLDLAMTGIRRSVHELHDDSIDLAIGVNDIAKTLPERFKVDISTSIESPADNTTKTAILGIIKEACTNISKHSNGDKVRIEVVENASFWRVLIHDNGKCPEREYSLSSTSTSDGHGIGLSNIYDRASSMGGRVNIKSGSSGFDVLATLPKTK